MQEKELQNFEAMRARLTERLKTADPTRKIYFLTHTNH